MRRGRFTRGRWWAGLSLGVLAGVVTVQTASVGWPDVRGLYLYTFNDAITKAPGMQVGDAVEITQALDVPGIDGLALVEDWNSIEPGHGVFQWDGIPPGSSLFDQWLAHAIARGKKINLVIRAGQGTPCWLFKASDGLCTAYAGSYAGAHPWSFLASAHQGAGKCDTVNIAVPWDPVFLYEWDKMLGAVAQHLRDIGAYEAVQLVRLTGINRTTDEFRLPEEILSTASCQSNSISTWLRAGYRPAFLLVAWDIMTASFERSFPDKLFSLSIIPMDIGAGQYPFPEIDEAGCVYTSIVPTSTWSVPVAIPPNTCTDRVDRATADNQLGGVLFWLLAIADARFTGRLAVEFENLTANVPANQTVVQAADWFGTKAAFQTNDFLSAAGGGTGAECGPLGSGILCTSQTYLDLLNEGVYPCQNPSQDGSCESATLRATFLEVFAPDVLGYSSFSSQIPDAIGTAHAELVAPGP